MFYTWKKQKNRTKCQNKSIILNGKWDLTLGQYFGWRGHINVKISKNQILKNWSFCKYLIFWHYWFNVQTHYSILPSAIMLSPSFESILVHCNLTVTVSTMRQNHSIVDRTAAQTLTKSGHRGLKFARQSIHRILWPHPCSSRPCLPAVTPGSPIRPPKGRKTPPKLTVFP